MKNREQRPKKRVIRKMNKWRGVRRKGTGVKEGKQMYCLSSEHSIRARVGT